MTSDPEQSQKMFSQKAKEALTGLAASAKAAAQLAAKQAARTKLTNVTLPHAYRELGKDIHATGRYRDQFPEEFAKADELKEEIAGLRQAAPDKEGEAKSFTDRAKETAGKARDAAHAKKLEVELNSVLRKLGRAAFEKLGADSGSPELVAPIEECQQRLATLDAEIQAIDSNTASGVLTPRRLLVGAGVLTVLVLGLGAWAMFGGSGSEPQVAATSPNDLESAQSPVTREIPTGVPDVGGVVGDARSRLSDMTRRVEEQHNRNEATSEAARENYEATRTPDHPQTSPSPSQPPAIAVTDEVGPSTGEEPSATSNRSTSDGPVQPAQADEADLEAQRERAEILAQIDKEIAAVSGGTTESSDESNLKSPITEIACLDNYDLGYTEDEATFSPDGRRAMLFRFGTVRVWDVESQELVASTKLPTRDMVILSPEAKYLLYSHTGVLWTYWVWNSETGGEPLPLNLDGFYADPSPRPVFTLRDKYAMVRYRGGMILNGRPMNGTYIDPTRPRNESDFVDRKNEVALVVWDLTTMKQVHRYDGYSEGAFLPESEKLLLAKPDSTPNNSSSLTCELDLLNFDGEVQRTFSLVTPDPDTLGNKWMLSGDGKSLLTISLHRDKRQRLAASTMVRCFDVETGRKLYEFMLGELSESWSILSRIRGVSYDGSLLLLNTEETRDVDSQVEIWDVPKGQMINRLEAETGGSFHVRHSEFYPYKGSLLTRDNDLLEAASGTIALWDVQSGERVVEYSRATDVSCVLAGLVCNDRQAVLCGNGFRFMQLPDWEPRKAARKLKFEGFGLLQELGDFREVFPDSVEQSNAVERWIGLTSVAAKGKSQGSELLCRFMKNQTWQIECKQTDAARLKAQLSEQLGTPSVGPTTNAQGATQMTWEFPGVKLREAGTGMHIELGIASNGQATVILTNLTLKAKVRKALAKLRRQIEQARLQRKSIAASASHLRVGMSFAEVLAVLGRPHQTHQKDAPGKQVVMWTYYPEPGKVIGLGFTNGTLLEWEVGNR